MCWPMFELALAFQWTGNLKVDWKVLDDTAHLFFLPSWLKKKASIWITNARWAQALKNALSFSQSSNLDSGTNPSNNFILVYSTIFYIHFSGFDSVTFEQTLNESTKVNILKVKCTQ